MEGRDLALYYYYIYYYYYYYYYYGTATTFGAIIRRAKSAELMQAV
jgi:hypothetical protein